MVDMKREPEEGYAGAYYGMGFGTGVDALEWLNLTLAAYPEHHIPVWVEAASPLKPEAPDLSIGVLLPITGKTMIVYAVVAAQEEIDEAVDLVSDSLVARAHFRFVRG
ncbi:hypothetical protein LCGC14_0826310 [marine sediment metagenome]|uniref:Uncharacterized protein n=1 Tax=marine sediment metagenome TaxID=412755 RepID=A0A0F9SPN8_9ZZZZ